MPDESGKLTAEEQATTLKWIETRWCDPCRCGVCLDVAIEEYLVSAHAYEEYYGGPEYPFVLVTCLNCGRSEFLNAFVVGILEAESDGDDGESEA